MEPSQGLRCRRLPALTMAAFTLLAVSTGHTQSTVSAQDYDVGYKWKRSAQWQPGVEVGSAEGNPGTDTLGNPVWGYVTTTGDGTDGLSSAAPWYAAERTLMIWDRFQHGENPPRERWARDGGSEPAISKSLISTSRTPSYGGWLYRAMVSWENPAGHGATVDLRGDARLVWGGPGQNFDDYGVELAIVKFDASADAYLPLLAQELQRPEDNPIGKNKWELIIPVDFRGISMDAGDELLFTIKNLDSSPAPRDAWVSFYDRMAINLVGISVARAVPEPANWALLAPSLGLLAWRVQRQRRRRPAAAPT
jgi:hypothetical protein